MPPRRSARAKSNETNRNAGPAVPVSTPNTRGRNKTVPPQTPAPPTASAATSSVGAPSNGIPAPNPSRHIALRSVPLPVPVPSSSVATANSDSVTKTAAAPSPSPTATLALAATSATAPTPTPDPTPTTTPTLAPDLSPPSSAKPPAPPTPAPSQSSSIPPSTAPPSNTAALSALTQAPDPAPTPVSTSPAMALVSAPLARASDSEKTDQVFEVPLEPSTRGTVDKPNIEPAFSIANYIFKNSTVSLSKMEMPSTPSREINEDHVKNLIKLFNEKGFNPVMGTFVVVPEKKDENALDEHETLEMDKNGALIGDCVLVDGRHRYTALQRLYKQDPDKWTPIWNNAPIACVVRNDNMRVTVLEQLALSAYFNDLSSAVLKVTFLDHVHAAIQTANVLAYLTRKHPGELTVTSIAKELQDRRTLGAIDHRQLRRYAAVAHKLAQRHDYYKSMKAFCSSCPGIGLVHLNSAVLLSMSDIDMWQLALYSLRTLLLNGVKGSFETFHASFYLCVKNMFELVRKAATHKEMSLDKLLESHIPITAHASKPLFDYMADTMGRYAMVENQEAADNSRLRNLKKKLIQLLGDDVEPTPPSTGGVKKPLKDTVSQKSGVEKEQSGVRRSKRKRTAVQVSDPDSEQEVRRTTRKRKAKQVSEDESGSDFSEGKERSKDAMPRRAIPKDRARHRPSKKRSTASSRKADSATVDLTENVISNFLKGLQPEQLTRMMSRLGVQVVSNSSNPALGRGHAEDKAMSAAMPLEVLPTFYDSFDDSLPATLPDTWADPPPYTGPPNPLWLRFATKLPSKWPADNPVAHISPWLEALHVPHEHRAHSVITNLHILRHNHHAVYIRAAHAFYKQRPVSELPELPAGFGATITTNEKLWCAAVAEDDVALEFFGAKKEQLNNEGFCILENFLHDQQIPKSIGNHRFSRFDCPNPFFTSLQDEARASFPGEESLSDPAARTTWNIMQNVTSQVDSSAVIQGQGRFRMTNYGILERLEKTPETLWTINGRALVDIRVAQCLAALKVAEKPRAKRLFMPRTGGRWIMTSSQCQRQVLHTDFKPLSRHDTLSENKCPGYFTIATGDREVPFWVCSHSHRLAATSSTAKIRAASSASAAHMIRIPPFSVFVGRGDLYYSALGTEDAIGNHRSLYYHTFFVPENADLPRVVSRNPDFNPRYTANLDEESEEESNEEIQPTTTTDPSRSRRHTRDVESDDNYGSEEIREARKGDGSDDDVNFSQYLG